MIEKVLIEENNFEKARKLIKENSGKEIIFTSYDDDLNRKILEKEKINILLLKESKRRDFHKQRNSGFNIVLAKLAKKNEIIIGINLDEIINAKGKEKSLILARVKQNIEICKKEKLNMKFIAEKWKKDTNELKSLGLILGMPTWMTKAL